MADDKFGSLKREEQQRIAARQQLIERSKLGRQLVESGAVDLQNLAQKATQEISQNRAERNKLGILSQEEEKTMGADLKAKRAQDSVNRRLLREIKRTERTGRLSSWLSTYAAQKETEANSANSLNAAMQQLPINNSSINVRPTSGTEIGGVSVAPISGVSTSTTTSSGGMVGGPP